MAWSTLFRYWIRHSFEGGRKFFGEVFQGLWELNFPPGCLACGEDLSDSVFCKGCWADVEVLGPSVCGACERALGPGSVCGVCCSPESPLDAIHAWGYYRGALRKVVLRMKVGAVPALARRWDAASPMPATISP